MDAIDISIIRLLRTDGRRSNRDIARILSLSEGAVRQRIKKLEEAKSIQFGLVMDRSVAGLTWGAYVSLKAEPDRVRQIARAIAEHEMTQFVGIVLGEYDIIAFVVGQSRDELMDYVDRSVVSIDGVVAAQVKEPVAVLKHRHDLMFNLETERIRSPTIPLT